MSEKPPQFERPPVRVVGKSSEETKDKLRQKIGDRFKETLPVNFSDAVVEKFKALEYDKKPYELDFIIKANEVINKLREKYGLPSFQVSPDKLHILPPELLIEAGYSTNFVGLQDANRQLIALNAESLRQNITRTGRNMLHEITHLMGYVAFEAVEDGEEETEKETDLDNKEGKSKKDVKWTWGSHRVGLMTFGPRRKFKEETQHTSFRGLNEAIVSEIENRHTDDIINSSNDPAVLAELEWLSSDEAKRIKEEISKKQNIPEDEIVWVNKDQKAPVIATEKSYRSQRRTFHYIVGEIAEDTGRDKEDIMDMFFKAHFTGNLVDIARMINKAFDDELAFRTIGMMGGENQDGRQMLGYLKKRRMLAKRKISKDTPVR